MVLRKITFINTILGCLTTGVEKLIPKTRKSSIELEIKEESFFLLKIWTKKEILYFDFGLISSENEEQAKKDSLLEVFENQRKESAEIPLLAKFVTLRRVTCTFEGNDVVLIEKLEESDEIYVFDGFKNEEELKILLGNIEKEDSKKVKIIYISEYLKPLI